MSVLGTNTVSSCRWGPFWVIGTPHDDPRDRVSTSVREFGQNYPAGVPDQPLLQRLNRAPPHAVVQTTHNGSKGGVLRRSRLDVGDALRIREKGYSVKNEYSSWFFPSLGQCSQSKKSIGSDNGGKEYFENSADQLHLVDD